MAEEGEIPKRGMKYANKTHKVRDRQTGRAKDKAWDTASHKGLATSEHRLGLKIKHIVIGVGGLKGA